MELKKLKPFNNSCRHAVKLSKNQLTKSVRLVKTLSTGLHYKAGRNNSGRITVRHKGGRLKKLFKDVDLNHNCHATSLVVSLFYDSSRSGLAALNFDLTSKFFYYSKATHNIFPGTLIKCSSSLTEFGLGSRVGLAGLPTGSLFHSLDIEGKTVYSKSAGTQCQLLQKKNLFYKIRLPSGKIITLLTSSFATLGSVSNLSHNLVNGGRAGFSRLKGVRPSVRGIAMNPVDHPHGGRTNGGMNPVTPWGLPTRGHPTKRK